MNMAKTASRFWKFSKDEWNFGDAIAEVIFQDLLCNFIPYRPNPWVIGSVVFDGVATIDSSRDNEHLPLFSGGDYGHSVFWGCGEREPGSLTAEIAQHCAFLGVRGPLTSSDLGLPPDTPMGDPALFLPALYHPRSSPQFSGKYICFPHFSDLRTDEELLDATGCDVVLRPLIRADVTDVLRIVDALASAAFVFAGAMHGAIVAAAYGVPFAYMASDNIDCPFKWDDFSTSIHIPCQFHQTLDAGRAFYEKEIGGTLQLPSLWPLLCHAPTFVRPEGLLKVVAYEMAKDGSGNAAALSPYIAGLTSARQHTDHLDRLACRVIDEILPDMASAHGRLSTLTDELYQQRVEITARTDELVAAQADVQRLQLALAAERDRRGQLDDEVQELAASRDALREELMAIERDFLLHITEKANEAASARVDAEVHRLENQRLVSQLAQLQSEVSRLTELNVELRIDARFGEAENKRLAAELALAIGDARCQAEGVVEQIASLATVNTNLNADMAYLRQALEDARSRSSGLENDVEQARHEMNLVARDRDGFRERSDSLARAVDALDHEVVSRDQAILDQERSLRVIQEEAVAQAAAANDAIDRFGAFVHHVGARRIKAGLGQKYALSKSDREKLQDAESIMQFIGQFPDHVLGMSSEGRWHRVLAYVFGATSCVADFPLLDRNHYYARNPDVAEAGIDPFIHYIKHGQRDGRSPSYLIDYDFYVQNYQETARFDTTVLEHFVKFGVAKGYNPCGLFDTKFYLQQFPDVKSSGINPLIHYIRNPDCRPHPVFDSHFYRRANVDVVRHRFNPLLHYLASGQEEGRASLPSPQVSQARNAVQAALQMQADAGAVEVAANVPTVRQIVRPDADAASRNPVVVMIDAFYPRPDEDSGSLDQVNYIRIFKSLGYDVAFISLLQFGDSTATRHALEAVGAECITAEKFVNAEEFLFLNADRIAAFFLSRYNFGASWIERARMFCPDAQIIFNTVDLHHIREERHARLNGDEARLALAAQMRMDELDRVHAADFTIVVSQAEKDILGQAAPTADVRVVPLVREIPPRRVPGFDRRSGIAFVGGFQHTPNVDAVTTFLDTVWPLVLQQQPGLVLHVIGSHMPDSLAERADPNVEWIGYVPELEPWLDRVCATIAPLRFGAGAKGKVVSSLLNAVPCIASEIAFEGMGLADGEGIVVARSPEDYARHIFDLTRNSAHWAEMSQRGFNAVRQTYSLERGVELVSGMLPRLIAK